jgi:hypothetical protein
MNDVHTFVEPSHHDVPVQCVQQDSALCIPKGPLGRSPDPCYAEIFPPLVLIPETEDMDLQILSLDAEEFSAQVIEMHPGAPVGVRGEFL